jgi:hypothetical protein
MLFDLLDQVIGYFTGRPVHHAPSQAVDLFLAGHSIPALTAWLHPGVGGPPMIDLQRRMEAEIRTYIGELQDEIRALQEEIEGLHQTLAECERDT